MKLDGLKHVVFTLGLACLLQACGGGGDGDDVPPAFTLSGTIRPVAGSAVDHDVNDPNAAYQTNDTPASAQAISNPVTLGGYANQPGTGVYGRSQATGDVNDYYRVSLLAGQQIHLLMAGDGVQHDLDLSLADVGGAILDASLGQTPIESLTAPADGEYLVIVNAYSGASNYVLTIGQSLGTTSTGARLSDSFVPGEAIVRFHDEAVAKTDGLRARTLALGLIKNRRNEIQQRNTLLNLTRLRQAGAYQTLASTDSPTTGEFRTDDPALRDKLETLYLIKTLKRDPDVAEAVPNHTRRPLFTPNDPLYSQQWHYPQINLPQAWDVTTGSGAIVAVIDTGVVFSHPDLKDQFVDGYDFISNSTNAGDGDGIDADPSDPGDQRNSDGSSSFHGTHVTGTVIAATNNNTGVAGVAFGAKVMPLRVCGRSGCTVYDTEQAARFAAGLPNDSGTIPARRADVMNLSLGGPGGSSSEQAVINQIRAAGVIIVAAAGNKPDVGPTYPAAYAGVIGVGAVGFDKQLAPYSLTGSWVGVAAPGGNTAQDLNNDGRSDGVLSTFATDSGGTLATDYAFWEGTSMATPHVAGVIALMKAVAPNLTPGDVHSLLATGALTDDLGTPGRDDQFGYGLINANKAVTAAQSGPPPITPVLSVNPTALNFGINLNSQTVTVLNIGNGSLTVNPPSENSGGWLSIAPTQINADGTGSYTVTVRRDQLADGVYKATVTFAGPNANAVGIEVAMQVANNLSAGAIGQQYVLLLDLNTHTTVVDVRARQQADGGYAFVLSNIPAGAYELFAGSDSNNDQAICDLGESCGAYTDRDTPTRIQVDQNLSGLDFVSGLVVNVADYQPADAPGGVAGLQRDLTRRGPTP